METEVPHGVCVCLYIHIHGYIASGSTKYKVGAH